MFPTGELKEIIIFKKVFYWKMATETQLMNIIRIQNNRISKLEERLEQALLQIHNLQVDKEHSDSEISEDPLSITQHQPQPNTPDYDDLQDSASRTEYAESVGLSKYFQGNLTLSKRMRSFCFNESATDSPVPEAYNSSHGQFCS